MKVTAALLGLFLLILIVPGSSCVPYQPISVVRDQTPISNVPLDELSVAAVVEYATSELFGDAFVKVDGLEVKESNYRGVAVGGRMYFYCLAPHFCSCPVCRGVLNPTNVEFTCVEEPSGFSIVVYSLDRPAPSVVEVNVPSANRIVLGTGWRRGSRF